MQATCSELAVADVDYWPNPADALLVHLVGRGRPLKAGHIFGTFVGQSPTLEEWQPLLGKGRWGY
jgi:hypothetical protein